MNLEEHLKRQIAFSAATFGPGERMLGVVDHIRKELDEIVSAAHAGERAAEWVDVVILGLDGLTRALRAEDPEMPNSLIADIAAALIVDKQDRNERRTWPNWRTQSQDKAIEHDRSAEGA